MSDYTVEGGFDWQAYKANVAASVLPVILTRTWKEHEHDNRQLRNADSVAISHTIDIAVEIADELERRLKE